MKKNAVGLVLMLSVILFGYTSEPNQSDSSSEQISFETSEKGTLVIYNESGLDLVILAGNASISSEDIVLGGIRAGSTRAFDCSGVRKFDEGIFLLSAVKFKDYKNRKIHFGDAVFSTLILPGYQNITITEHAGGKEYFFIDNTSNCLLQLRINSPNGELLTSIMPLSSGNKIYFEPSYRDLILFCSYIAWDGNDLSSLKTYQDKNPIRIRYGADAVYQFTQPKSVENMSFHIN